MIWKVAIYEKILYVRLEVFNLRKPLAVVCHDAGAANVILSWFNIANMSQTKFVMRGPAAKLIERKFPDVRYYRDFEPALQDASTLLSGTGWSSDFEHNARLLAKSLNIHSIAVLDHWLEYSARFKRLGTSLLPDEIWVLDKWAADIAEDLFPDTDVYLKRNMYLEEEIFRIRERENINNREVLYVLEPILSQWGQGKSGEFQALEYFLENREAVGIPNHTPIKIRPHPSEPKDKYADWCRRQTAPVFIDYQSDLASAIARARWVVGCHSYAMIVALNAGREVISSLPPWAPPCPLPHKQIIRLCERL